MGTTYSIKYIGLPKNNLKNGIDSLLLNINNSVSTYIPTSEISEFNKNGRLIFQSKHFKNVLYESAKIVQLTQGAFDPTVMPLVNAYGFGFKEKNIPDSLELDSIMQLVGFEKIKFNEDSVWNILPNVQLDFSAIAKGYGVDMVYEYLLDNGIINFMVEIGGEVRCKGVSIEDKNWIIGIINPLKQDELFEKVTLINKSMATSGNYRNYYEENGQKYSHTINPITGKVERNTMLSATIIAENCMTADALATAFMVLGVEKSIELASKNSSFNVYYIYSEDSGTNSFSNFK